eukprot:1657800-Prymnesium_polylepis.2
MAFGRWSARCSARRGSRAARIAAKLAASSSTRALRACRRAPFPTRSRASLTTRRACTWRSPTRGRARCRTPSIGRRRFSSICTTCSRGRTWRSARAAWRSASRQRRPASSMATAPRTSCRPCCLARARRGRAVAACAYGEERSRGCPWMSDDLATPDPAANVARWQHAWARNGKNRTRGAQHRPGHRPPATGTAPRGVVPLPGVDCTVKPYYVVVLYGRLSPPSGAFAPPRA